MSKIKQLGSHESAAGAWELLRAQSTGLDLKYSYFTVQWVGKLCRKWIKYV